MSDSRNPFDLVKANDLSDGEIADYFVDFPGGSSLIDRIKPTSPMPMFVLGGKGSGKTHLMRYLAYPQKLRSYGPGRRARNGIAKEGYLGIYFRCGGLNAQRFAGKGQSPDVWQGVFAYCMELWVAQLVLAAIRDLYEDEPDVNSADMLADATRLFDIGPPAPLLSLAEISTHLETLQREADVAINNCGLTRRLDLVIQATPGRLVFGLPGVLVRHLSELASVRFLYLIDELENLTVAQQRYINTLVRERQDPCGLKIGVRLYGFRTRETLNAQEENREDSEYEVLRLDTELRERPPEAQLNFATDLIRKRLVQSGYLTSLAAEHVDLSEWFQPNEQDLLVGGDTETSARRNREQEPPYVASLRRKLQQGVRAGAAPGLKGEADVDKVISLVRVPEHSFVERVGIFLLYRGWARHQKLLGVAESIGADAKRYIRGDGDTKHSEVLKHFRADILAQLLRETKQRQRYVGLDTFVKMSAGLPRGMLTILKYVFTWSLFFGEKPFREGQISVRAQVEGVAQASEWFFTEARSPGPNGALVRDAMTRTGQLLRDVRFSDKPSECSLSTFSVDLTKASTKAVEILREAENWSMVLRVAGGQHDRNEGRVDDKYQVHPMLAPRWDLPIARRGALAFSGEEINALFAPLDADEFDAVAKRRIATMMAPFFGRTPPNATPLLPGMTDG